MGKRKSRKKPVAVKKVAKIGAIFDCPECNHNQCVECNIDRKLCMADISCRVCKAYFSHTKLNDLEEPIDVYYAWRDSLAAATDGSSAPEGVTLAGAGGRDLRAGDVSEEDESDEEDVRDDDARGSQRQPPKANKYRAKRDQPGGSKASAAAAAAAAASSGEEDEDEEDEGDYEDESDD